MVDRVQLRSPHEPRSLRELAAPPARQTGFAELVPGQPAPAGGKISPPVAELARAAAETRPAEVVEEALDTLSKQLQNLNRTLQFSVDRNSGDTIIRVIDSETEEVVRQIPSEEMLAIAERLRAATGVLLVDAV
jgi:flagellar protein FlaG